jgi:hypothetical protein
MLVSIAAAGTLMVGLGSTVYLTSRATNDSDRPMSKVIDSSLSINDIAGELHYAVSFIERSNRAVEFTIADRTGDTAAETIRYEWSGTAGAPITRRFNGGTPQVVCENVHDFDLAYTVQMVEEVPEAEAEAPSTPTETLAASLLVWHHTDSDISVADRDHLGERIFRTCVAAWRDFVSGYAAAVEARAIQHKRSIQRGLL